MPEEAAKFPFVTIILPTFNSVAFVQEAVDGALAQDYANFEVIVADDCSTDGTREVLERYTGNRRMRLLLNSQNLGVTENVENALHASRGDFVCFTAGDDILYPNCISTGVRKLTETAGAVAFFHEPELIDAKGEALPRLGAVRTAHVGCLEHLLREGFYVKANGMMLAGGLARETKHRHDLRVASDFMHIAEALDYSHGTFIYAPEPLSAWRQHPASATKRLTWQGRRDQLRTETKLAELHPWALRHTSRRVAALIWFGARSGDLSWLSGLTPFLLAGAFAVLPVPSRLRWSGAKLLGAASARL